MLPQSKYHQPSTHTFTGNKEWNPLINVHCPNHALSLISGRLRRVGNLELVSPKTTAINTSQCRKTIWSEPTLEGGELWFLKVRTCTSGGGRSPFPQLEWRFSIFSPMLSCCSSHLIRTPAAMHVSSHIVVYFFLTMCILPVMIFIIAVQYVFAQYFIFIILFSLWKFYKCIYTTSE